jgi:hypothetical protein
MNLSIHQPQYLPWLPYLMKIGESDLFIFLDSVDFQKNGLQNRNQIKTAQGPLWLTIPVKHELGQKIKDVKIDNKKDWRRKHWQTIQQCYSKATAFKVYEQQLGDFYSNEWEGLSELNIEFTNMILTWMGISTKVMRSSEMKAKGNASDLVLNLCLEAGATRYLSGIGGKNYLKEDSFKQAGIEIVYLPANLPETYPQLFPKAGFINDLAALDIMLNCGSEWRGYLYQAQNK